MYKKNGELWEVVETRDNIVSIEGSGNHLSLCDYQLVLNFDQNGIIINTFYGLGDKLLNPYHAIEDLDGSFWIADNFYGLVKLYINGTNELIKPKGPEKIVNFKLVDLINGGI